MFLLILALLSRRVKTGLISVDIVSHWCWSSTILQSANQAWIYGVTGPYWYAGGRVDVVLPCSDMLIHIPSDLVCRDVS